MDEKGLRLYCSAAQAGTNRRFARLIYAADSFPRKEAHMKTLIAVAATFLLLGVAQRVVADKPENSPGALLKKLHGAWQGQSAWQGDLALQADGTFEKTKCGPGNDNFAGTWEVRWDAL